MEMQCRAFVEDLLASHSTDLQQRAYELQSFLSLSQEIVQKALPFNASGKEIEVYIYKKIKIKLVVIAIDHVTFLNNIFI